jgi:hypothetical protein
MNQQRDLFQTERPTTTTAVALSATDPRRPHPEHLTTTDFHADMDEDHGPPALCLLFAKRPNLKPP